MILSLRFQKLTKTDTLKAPEEQNSIENVARKQLAKEAKTYRFGGYLEAILGYLGGHWGSFWASWDQL